MGVVSVLACNRPPKSRVALPTQVGPALIRENARIELETSGTALLRPLFRKEVQSRTQAWAKGLWADAKAGWASWESSECEGLSERAHVRTRVSKLWEAFAKNRMETAIAKPRLVPTAIAL